MLPKNLLKIFGWPEMCPLGKSLAQDFQIVAFTKILGGETNQLCRFSPRKIVKHSSNKNAHMYCGDCDAAIAKAAAAVTHVQSQI